MIFSLFISVGIVIFLYITCWFVISRIFRRNDVADIAWGPGIALVGLIALFLQEEQTVRMLLLASFGVIWGLRLGIHIFLRNSKKSEDRRYIEMAKHWGKWFLPITYLQVFVLQGILMVCVGYAFIHTSVYDTSSAIDAFMIVGALIWFIGLFFEVVGDYQLARFLKDPVNKGKIMQSGLWKYTRHPNYFGEVFLWWGVFITVLPVNYFFVALITPFTITYLILKVSGIPMTERHFEGNPEWELYKSRTNAFFPLPPKKI